LLTSPSGMSSMKYDPPRFLVDRETMARRKSHGTNRSVRRPRFLRRAALRGVLHLRADGLCTLGNLFTDFESFDPPSTPAMEVRVVPMHNLYVKSMVEAEDRDPFAHSPTGLVPQFRGVPVSTSEIGFAPGEKATSVRAFDTVESRKGYSGLYQFGASYNPGKFTTASGVRQSGDYLLHWMASQAIWRVDPKGAKGLDRT